MESEVMTDEKFADLLDAAAQIDGAPVLTIFKETDGNWRGAYAKDGWKSMNGRGGQPTVFIRDVGPETVLQRLLTNDGK